MGSRSGSGRDSALRGQHGGSPRDTVSQTHLRPAEASFSGFSPDHPACEVKNSHLNGQFSHGRGKGRRNREQGKAGTHHRTEMRRVDVFLPAMPETSRGLRALSRFA